MLPIPSVFLIKKVLVTGEIVKKITNNKHFDLKPQFISTVIACVWKRNTCIKVIIIILYQVIRMLIKINKKLNSFSILRFDKKTVKKGATN